MIIFIISDIDGLNSLSDDTLRRLSIMHDAFFINISDAYMTSDNSFDIEKENYIPEFFLKDKQLKIIENDIKTKIYEEMKERYQRYKIMVTTINKQDEIVREVFKILERRKNANLR